MAVAEQARHRLVGLVILATHLPFHTSHLLLHFGTAAEPRGGSFPCLPVAKLLAALTWVFLQVFLPNLAV